MSVANVIFLGVVLAAFVSYGVLLFGVWLFIEVIEKKKPAQILGTPEIAAAARSKALS